MEYWSYYSFYLNCDNPRYLIYTSLHNCVSRILKRGTVNDKKRSGRPVTVTTSKFRKNVNKCIELKKVLLLEKQILYLKEKDLHRLKLPSIEQLKH